MKKYEVEFSNTMREESVGYDEYIEAETAEEAVLLFIDWLKENGDEDAENHIYFAREHREWYEESEEWVIDPHK